MRKISKKGKKIIGVFILVLVLAGAITFGVLYGLKTFKKPTVKVEKLDEMKEYDYYLEDNKSDLYKKLYKELKTVLNKKEVDEEEYAKLVSRLCIADYYNLDNKMSKNDIGCTQFIKEEYRENFILESSDTVYKYIEQNIEGNRTQKLPIVSSVEVSSTDKISYSYDKINDTSAYDVKLKVTYKEDLGYPTDVEIKLVHTDKKLDIIYIN